MRQACHYSPASRQAEKERQRASDAQDLREGIVSRDDQRCSNGFLASLDIVESSIICEEVFG